MKTRILIFAVFSILLLIATISFVEEVHAQSDCTAYSGTAITDDQIDGVIGTEWSDAWASNIGINPTGTADIWMKQDGTSLYLALRFTADSADPWVGIQFGPSFCMSPSGDGALFGDDNYAANGYKDIYFVEGGQIGVDATQNGVGAINVNSSNVVVVELKKPLNSGDTAGKDINWTQACSYPMVIIWDSNGAGSNGGSENHAVGATASVKTVFISSETSPVPEFPSSTVLIVVGVAAILVVGLTKRYSQKK